MQKLVKGIHHFQANVFSSQRELFERLASGQTPDALFITCSDSRINPNLITNTNPGELFIVRNVGAMIPAYSSQNAGEAAAIEYALGVLRIKDIIVCGHSHCGAMESLLHPEAVKEMPEVARWLGSAEATRRIIASKYDHLRGEALLTVTAEENVLVQIENLRTHPAVAVALSQGKLKLHGWVYKIQTGDIFAYDPLQAQFLSLAEATSQDTAEIGAANSRCRW